MGVPSYDFSGRRVLVVGGTRGLGHQVARSFQRSGAAVTVTGTQSLTSAYDVRLDAFSYLRLDLTSHDSIVRVAEQVGAVDIVVNAAGARIPHSSDVHEQEFVSHSVRLGLLGPSQLTHRLRHRLAESSMRGGGAVVNTHHVRRWCEMAVGAANAHTEMLNGTARLAAAWAANGVRVNGVASTVMVPRQSQLRVQIDRQSGPLLTRTRTQRTGTLQDVTSAVLFLASTGSAFITGQTLMVNGSGAGGARIAY
ncbi:SDR family NAD(P)-dependent oxidoreductase [Nocardioides jensenii]|uniref:SDR family NAD(P)-dependent oxidoreductase n=1 Tax=Nocardioides jensenii TaxID=1843 RepID=UPI0008367E1D|nr:SDR family oxidoreductase [Nocardioides jensenii]